MDKHKKLTPEEIVLQQRAQYINKEEINKNESCCCHEYDEDREDPREYEDMKGWKTNG